MVYAGRAELAEGPVWKDGALWWVDIVAGTLNRLDPSSGMNRARATGDFLGAAIPAGPGMWLLARRREVALYDWNRGRLLWRRSYAGLIPSSHRLNDGKCDARGRLWVGTLSLAGERRACALLSGRPPAEALCPRLVGVTLSNGLDWSPSGDRFYFADTGTRRVDRFRFSLEDGSLLDRQPLLALTGDEGVPDGLACDAGGSIWIACWGGGCVLRVDGDTGIRLEKVSVPALQVSSCTFGGPGNRTLFITSAWQGMTPQDREKEPLAGSIFAVRTDTEGRPPNQFRIP